MLHMAPELWESSEDMEEILAALEHPLQATAQHWEDMDHKLEALEHPMEQLLVDMDHPLAPMGQLLEDIEEPWEDLVELLEDLVELLEESGQLLLLSEPLLMDVLLVELFLMQALLVLHHMELPLESHLTLVLLELLEELHPLTNSDMEFNQLTTPVLPILDTTRSAMLWALPASTT